MTPEPKKKCSGKISECEHSHSGMIWGFGSATNIFTGEVLYENRDPSFQCACCGFPIMSAEVKKMICDYCGVQKDMDDHRCSHILLQEKLRQKDEEIKRLREALESIANNTCCGKCQEASLWAKKALAQIESEKGN